MIRFESPREERRAGLAGQKDYIRVDIGQRDEEGDRGGSCGFLEENERAPLEANPCMSDLMDHGTPNDEFLQLFIIGSVAGIRNSRGRD